MVGTSSADGSARPPGALPMSSVVVDHLARNEQLGCSTAVVIVVRRHVIVVVVIVVVALFRWCSRKPLVIAGTPTSY